MHRAVKKSGLLQVDPQALTDAVPQVYHRFFIASLNAEWSFETQSSVGHSPSSTLPSP